jgi:hypothetical protein
MTLVDCMSYIHMISPHNANLAAKGIVGLAAYASLLQMAGRTHDADAYLALSQSYATQWMSKAVDSDASHFKLEYDLDSTWSLKYNLLWQRVLGLDLFPESVFVTEESFYASHFNSFGVPLDNRADFTKTDWMMWTGAMLSNTVRAREL